jgi:uncharacterized protein (DUF983 family)
MTNNPNPVSASQPSPLYRAWLYFYRSLQLKCPVCGRSPLFGPVRQVRSLRHWFETLPGCPHCNYLYDPEPGYFLLAFWMFDYGLAGLFGIGLFLVLYDYFNLAMLQVLWITLLAVTLFALLIVRHCKAFFLAMDHYFFRH